ncbi:hypothetical protein M2116_000801 [Aurantimicrobium minutum]|nr:hypothetical protein [Aurantimicrobium minutum]
MTQQTNTHTETCEALEEDRDYFKHFSRLHESRAKSSWKLLHKLDRLIDQGNTKTALALIREHLDIR